MLIVTRRSDESILISPSEDTDMRMTLEALFADGPIEIRVLGGTGRRVKMGVDAPEQLSIWRKGPVDKTRDK